MGKTLSSVVIILVILFSVSACYYEDISRPFDPSVCLGTDLMVTATSQSSSGCGNSDGSVTVTATGGGGTYSFSIDGGQNWNDTGIFSNLAGGNYLVIVFDGSQCADSTEVVVDNAGTDFQASIKSTSPNTGCLSFNGSVELQAAGGTGSYTFTFSNQTNSTGIFSGLNGGNYSVDVSDGNCTVSVSFVISNQSTISYANDIVPILNAKCNFSSCHGSGSPQINFTTYDNVKSKAADIKLRTSNGTMPKAPKPGGALSADQIQIIACWVDSGAQNN